MDPLEINRFPGLGVFKSPKIELTPDSGAACCAASFKALLSVESGNQPLDADHICGTLSADVRRPYATRPWRVRSYVDDGDVLPLGGRQLEVIFTPGHTPDSLCLLDRQNGLLFTGDTFYSGEIYLWAAETNLEDYRRSINRLAALVPALVHLFPAHGPPIASPQRLLEVKSAFSLVQNSSAAWTLDAEHRRLYRFGAFSFLLAAK